MDCMAGVKFWTIAAPILSFRWQVRLYSVASRMPFVLWYALFSMAVPVCLLWKLEHSFTSTVGFVYTSSFLALFLINSLFSFAMALRWWPMMSCRRSISVSRLQRDTMFFIASLLWFLWLPRGLNCYHYFGIFLLLVGISLFPPCCSDFFHRSVRIVHLCVVVVVLCNWENDNLASFWGLFFG